MTVVHHAGLGAHPIQHRRPDRLKPAPEFSRPNFEDPWWAATPKQLADVVDA